MGDNTQYDLRDLTKLPLSGGEMTGPLTWADTTALPGTTTASYFLVPEAFADGGTTKYISVENAATIIFKVIYPVGAIYLSTTNTNPSTFITDTTWVQLDSIDYEDTSLSLTIYIWRRTV